MMNYKINFGLLLLLIGVNIQAQQVNQIVLDKDLDSEIFLGEIEVSALNNPVFIENWEEQCSFYPTNVIIDDKLKEVFRKEQKITIDVYFASWCGDSQEYIPPFVELMKRCKMKRVKYYALSRKKTMPDFDIEEKQIEKVPTFIVYNDSIELGRIIESPENNLEQDLWDILQQKYDDIQQD